MEAAVETMKKESQQAEAHARMAMEMASRAKADVRNAEIRLQQEREHSGSSRRFRPATTQDTGNRSRQQQRPKSAPSSAIRARKQQRMALMAAEGKTEGGRPIPVWPHSALPPKVATEGADIAVDDEDDAGVPYWRNGAFAEYDLFRIGQPPLLKNAKTGGFTVVSTDDGTGDSLPPQGLQKDDPNAKAIQLLVQLRRQFESVGLAAFLTLVHDQFPADSGAGAITPAKEAAIAHRDDGNVAGPAMSQQGVSGLLRSINVTHDRAVLPYFILILTDGRSSQRLTQAELMNILFKEDADMVEYLRTLAPPTPRRDGSFGSPSVLEKQETAAAAKAKLEHKLNEIEAELARDQSFHQAIPFHSVGTLDAHDIGSAKLRAANTNRLAVRQSRQKRGVHGGNPGRGRDGQSKTLGAIIGSPGSPVDMSEIPGPSILDDLSEPERQVLFETIGVPYTGTLNNFNDQGGGTAAAASPTASNRFSTTTLNLSQAKDAETHKLFLRSMIKEAKQNSSGV
jgi:hypothetical protein